MRTAAKIVAARAGLGALAALLVQALFVLTCDGRPAYALLLLLVLAALAAGLGLLVVAPEPALWRRWRGVLAGAPARLGLAFILLAAARWSVMWIPYAGRPLVMGLLWLGVGLVLGSLLGVLDREGGDGGGAAAAFRRLLTLLATPIALTGLVAAYGALPGWWPAPSPLWLAALGAFCLVTLLGRGEPLPWRLAASFGVTALALALLASHWTDALPTLPPAARLVWGRLLKARWGWGAGPGSLTIFIAHRPSLGGIAAAAAETWRYRIPAELGLAGVVLGGAFLIALARLFPLRSPARRGRELRRFLGCALALILLALFTPAFARPEFPLWLGLTLGIAIGLSDRDARLRPYDGRLVAGVLLALAIGVAALAVTTRQQLAWRFYLRGLGALNRQEWSTAIDLLERANAIQPDVPDFSLAKASVYVHTSAKGLESPYLVRAGAVDPYRPEIAATLARFYAAHGRPLEAVETARRALALDPGNKIYLSEKQEYLRQEWQATQERKSQRAAARAQAAGGRPTGSN